MNDLYTADSLAADIRITNNGYLFAPSPYQVELAKTNPDRFKYTHNPRNSPFPHKIELK